MSRIFKVFTLLLVATLVLAACGGGGAPAPATEAVAEPAAAATDAAAEEAPTEEAAPAEAAATEEAAPAEEAAAAPGDVVFFSTQFVPVEEQEKFRAILQEAGYDVTGTEKAPCWQYCKQVQRPASRRST